MKSGPKPSVRYWPTRGAYCCKHNYRRVILAKGPDDAPSGPTYLAAQEQFQKLFVLEANKGTDAYLVSSLLNQYRAHLHEPRKCGVPGVFEVMARGFAEEFGPKRVCEVKPFDFDRWLAQQTQWNPTSKAHAVALILGALSWAKKKGFIQTDPLTGRVERPQAILRGRDARMSEELMDLLIGECFAKTTYHRRNRTDEPAVHLRSVGFSESFGRYLWLLRVTGARPIELTGRLERLLPNGVRQVYRWLPHIGYTDAQQRTWSFNAIQLEETVEDETTTFAWLTPLPVSARTVEAIATQGGRHRWKIENQGFNRQKNSDLNLHHLFSSDPEKLTAYYYLLQIACILLHLREQGSLLRRLAEAHGRTPWQLFGSLKNLAWLLLESLRCAHWPTDCFAAPHSRIRFAPFNSS